jgi:hypothetical protein
MATNSRPGAIAIAIGLYGMVFLSYSITRNYAKYGALGRPHAVVHIGRFSVVMFGGAVVGVTLHEHPLRRIARNTSRGENNDIDGVRPPPETARRPGSSGTAPIARPLGTTPPSPG